MQELTQMALKIRLQDAFPLVEDVGNKTQTAARIVEESVYNKSIEASSAVKLTCSV